MQATILKLVGLVVTPLISRSLSVKEFGFYTLVINSQNAGFGITKMGIDAGTHVLMAEDENKATQKDKILGAGLFLTVIGGICSSIAMFFLSDTIAVQVYANAEFGKWIKFSSALLFIQFFTQYFYAALVGFHQFKTYAFISISTALLNLCMVVILAFYKDLTLFILNLIFINAVTTTLLMVYFIKNLRRLNLDVNFSSLSQSLKSLLKLGLPFHLASLIPIPVSYFIEGILTQHIGIEVLGYLRIGMTFNGVLAFIPGSIAAATISSFTELRSKQDSNKEQFLRYNLINIKFLWIYGLLLAIILQITLPFILPLLFGAKYQPAVQISQVLLYDAVFGIVLGAIGNTFFAEKKITLILLQSILITITLAGMSYILIPLFSIMGYIYASLIGKIVVTTVFFFILRQRNILKVKESRTALLLFLTISAIILFIILTQVFSLLSSFDFYIISFVVLTPLIYFFVVSKEERSKLFSLITKRLKF